MAHAQLNWACYCSGNHAHAPLRPSIDLPELSPAPSSPIVISDSDDDEVSEPSADLTAMFSGSDLRDDDLLSLPPPPPPSEIPDSELSDSDSSVSGLDAFTMAPVSVDLTDASKVLTDGVFVIRVHLLVWRRIWAREGIALRMNIMR